MNRGARKSRLRAAVNFPKASRVGFHPLPSKGVPEGPKGKAWGPRAALTLESGGGGESREGVAAVVLL